MVAGLIGAAGVAVFCVIVARALDAGNWRRQLVAYELQLPKGLTAVDVANWLGALTASGGSRWQLLDAPPVALETTATPAGIQHYLVVPHMRETATLATLRAALPGVRLELAENYISTPFAANAAAELCLPVSNRPLASDRADTAIATFLAAQQPLAAQVAIRTQWLLTGAQLPRPASSSTLPDSDMPWLSVASRDAEALRAARLKQALPLLRACGRVGVMAPTTAQAATQLDRLLGSFRVLNAPGIAIRSRWFPGWWASHRLRLRTVPLINWPLLLNTAEAAALVGLPVGEVHLPGLQLGSARQLPPPPSLPVQGTVLGLSNYPGFTTRPLALSRQDRLRHTWLLGPTGSGKSTLLANLILQDCAANDAVVVIDARGDLVTDILSRLPKSRHADVLVLDPSQVTRPLGCNILQAPLGQHELVVDHVLHILHDLYQSSWGPRTADVLRASLLTLTSNRATNGAAFTLVDLPTLLTNISFRQSLLRRAALPPGLADFWHWYEQLSDAERASVIGPVLNKLRAFVLNRPLRLLLGQSQGFQMSDVLRRRQILLVSLSPGTLGSENTRLIGSLMIASLWQATLSRVRIPQEQRRPAWLYVDEFQETVRLPLDLADMLAQARGLGLGLTLAHQYLGQLPDSVKTAVLGTARTHISFQTGYDDATTLARSFAPLTRDDLMGLQTYEVAIRPCLNGRTASPVTGSTKALSQTTVDASQLAALSAERFGTPAADVETAIATRTAANPDRPVGRSRREVR